MASPIYEKILADITLAMKAGQKEQLSTLRMANAQIKDATTNAGKDSTDEAVITVVSKAIKQRRDSVEQYRSAGREELAVAEEREIDWLSAYLPEPLSAEALDALVAEAIAETGASGRQDMGNVMKAVMPKVKGRAEGQVISQAVMKGLA